jgi:transcription elongation factor GreA
MATDNKNDLNKEILVTKAGYDKLVEELEHLKNVRRKEVAEHLKEAISYGDLSENSEYEEAKNEQAFVEGRIIELERKVENAKIVKEVKTDKVGYVQLGAVVTLLELDDKEAKEEEYTLVGATEAEPFTGKVSNESPLGHALFEKKVGDVVTYEAPKGEVSYKIVKIK